MLLASPVDAKEEVSADSENLATKDGTQAVKCPYCADWVKAEAKVCKHCGRDIEAAVKKILAEAATARAERVSAQKQAKEEQYAAEQAELKAEAERRAAFQKTTKFKLIVTGSAAGFMLLVIAIVWLSIASPKSLRTSSEAANRWLKTMEECGFDIHDTSIHNDNSQGPIYLPSEQSGNIWAIQIVEQSGEDGAALIVDKTMNAEPVNCFSEFQFRVTITEEPITNKDEDSTEAIPTGYQRGYAVESESYVFYANVF